VPTVSARKDEGEGMAHSEFHITVDADQASDSWGFVGRVMVEDHECYRTLCAYPTPTEAQHAAQVLVADVLGELLAGREWRALCEEKGRVATRDDLGMGLRATGRATGR
jgi:hypothetical protein